MSKYCQNCGAEVADEAVVCVKCGCAVNGAKATDASKPPKTWLVQSILATIFCCLPLGIVGIINASKVESKFYAGEVDEANRLSAQAAKWTKWGFWIGLISYILGIAFNIVYALVFGNSLSNLSGFGY
ncbi:MAG: CD225/dispanin family protein [Paludibacter sp.]|jgi:hypothetical protein|nr:CD225/dispanin family protein [Paludibacter sp.]